MCQNIVRNTRSETLILSLGVFVTLLLLDAVQKSRIFTVSYFSVGSDWTLWFIFLFSYEWRRELTHPLMRWLMIIQKLWLIGVEHHCSTVSQPQVQPQGLTWGLVQIHLPSPRRFLPSSSLFCCPLRLLTVTTVANLALNFHWGTLTIECM